MARNRNEAVVCKDGFRMSVQAFDGAYCYPRIDNAEKYEEVEIGFPSEKEDLLMAWAEDHHDPTNTVYAYVPVQTVALVIAKHGGMIRGQLPPGVPALVAK